MGLELWRLRLSVDSASRLWLAPPGNQNFELRHGDYDPWRRCRRNSRRFICCRARKSQFEGGSKDLRGGGIEIPSSLQILKRRNRQKSQIPGPGELDGGNLVSSSIKKAFSSMVFMLKSMHRFTLEMLCCDENSVLNEVWSLVQREMHSSFLWLFQQVFSSTPKLMVSIMILLANFTVYSMDSSIAIHSPIVPSTALDRPAAPAATVMWSSPATEVPGYLNFFDEAAIESSGGSKDGGGKLRTLIAGGTDGGDEFPLSRRGRTTMMRDDQLAAPGNLSRNQQLAVMKFLQQVPVPAKVTKESLVAPVSAKLEPDNYECFDRTDLLYQQALGEDRKNPLILANYAQFLYVVRHDHDRAETLFRLAMEADPSDGESLSRFASFLWLARGDKQGAEDAYKNAIASDPANPFHFGSYAHFLWHSES
ncbi:hypothetical protein SELMODRAFT_444848 [Selaginella moellendorffii]|uniref:Uncharacterized protein n=1 Tax=Selaginella moellendorffii TaxID=88036 RepID=D8SDE2_SELML|nr:uncharacterized protein LOC9647393 [Selaginella moellendorffii]EFJ17498.1 hypothetical protein SELMODRAFT_444848 [Selaginella moellendorffii]|eukprot:XP_002981310.1 uncharacterized protein LOC9647393 [Selaginella moellendorffii]